MHLSVVQEQLKRGLHIVGHVVGAKAPLPVLSNVLLTAENGRLRLLASNLQTGVACFVDATVLEPGATTLPAKLLGDFVSTLPNETVTLLLDARTQSTQLQCAAARANIKGIDAEEFPMPSTADVLSVTTISGADLRSAIEQVAVMATTDDARPVLAGVLLKLNGTAATLAAMDGFRLAVKTLALAQSVADAQQVIVPAAALLELARVLHDDDTVEILIASGGASVLFRTATLEVWSRVLEGPFPSFERLIPRTFATRAVFERAALRQAVRQTALFVPERVRSASLALATSDGASAGVATLVANDGEIGDNRSELPAQITGADGAIKFNIAFLKSVIDVLDTPQVAFEMQTPTMPGVLRPVGDDRLLVIVMPMA